MATVPVLPAVTGGTYNTSAVSALISAVKFLMNPPAAKIYQSVAQTMTTGVWTSLTFTVENLDTDVDAVGGHDNATNTSRYTARYPGWYWCGGVYTGDVNATGRRQTRWTINGVTQEATAFGTTAAATFETSFTAIPTLLFLSTGDYLELQALQSSGGNLNTLVSTTWQSSGMSVGWYTKGSN